MPMQLRGCSKYKSYPFETSALEGGRWQRPTRTVLPPGNPLYALYRRLGGLGAGLDGTENFAPFGVRSPERTAPRE
jgi:hypothetical protein